MIGVSFKEAAVEVLDILAHTDKKAVEKIPKSFISFLQENSSKTYISQLDHSKKIKDMELKPKTEAILGWIYMKYWADEEGKKKFKNKIKTNEEILDKQEKIAFETVNFESNAKNAYEIGRNALPEEYKKTNRFLRIINKLKQTLRRKL